METKDLTKKTAKFKVEIIKNKDVLTFSKVAIREPLVDDMLEAEKYATDSEKSLALISQLCTFDGASYTMEDVRKLPFSDFLYLQKELVNRGLMGSEV